MELTRNPHNRELWAFLIWSVFKEVPGLTAIRPGQGQASEPKFQAAVQGRAAYGRDPTKGKPVAHTTQLWSTLWYAGLLTWATWLSGRQESVKEIPPLPLFKESRQWLAARRKQEDASRAGRAAGRPFSPSGLQPPLLETLHPGMTPSKPLAGYGSQNS